MSHRMKLFIGLPLALASTGCGWSLRAGPEVRSQAKGTVVEGRGTVVAALADASEEKGLQFGVPLSVSGGARVADGKPELTLDSGLELTDVSGHLGYRAGVRAGSELGHGGYVGVRGGPVWMIEPADAETASRAVTLEGLFAVGGGDLRGAALFGMCLSFGWDVYPPPFRLPSGRPFRESDGTEWRAQVRLGRRRSAALGARSTPAERDRVGMKYLDDALDEHASIATFQRLARELSAHGAPRQLIARARSAAVDEARHARTCCALATAYLGRDVAVSALPEPSARSAWSLADIARECWVDGCLGEGAAARAVFARAERTVEPSVRHALFSIARDERAHARLAQDVLAWCVRSAQGFGLVRR